jgi:diamine N-acetyltransferase
MNITIREANISDVGLLSELGRQTFFQTFADQNTKEDMDLYLNETFNLKSVSDQLRDENSYFFIIEYDGVPAGYSKLRKDGQDALEIERIYIAKKFQGKKLGKELMEHCVEFAKQKNYKRIWLGVWEKNEKAIAFYEKFGFIPFGSHVFILGTDPQTDLLMEKDLTKE